LGLPLLVFGIVSILLQRRIVGDQRRYITSATGRGMSTTRGRRAFNLVLAYGIIAVGIPLVAIALVALSPYWNGDLGAISLTLDNVREALTDPAVGAAIVNTFRASLLAAAIVLPLGFVSALALGAVVRAPRVVRATLDFVFIAPLAVPRALLGMAVLFVFIQRPFSLYGSLLLFEASRVCGASQLRMVTGIALPIARRGIAAALALAFVLLSNDFAVSIMLRTPGNQVLGTLLYEKSVQGNVPAVAVLALIMTVITTIILLLTIRFGGKSTLEGL
jgi:iron(III) transport system permease protein